MMLEDVIKKVWPSWNPVKKLGQGSFGTVYKAVRNDNKIEVASAIKVIAIPQDQSEYTTLRSEGLTEMETATYFRGIVDDFVNEIVMMESFRGMQNIVSIEDYQVTENPETKGWTILVRMELLTPFDEYILQHQLTVPEVLKLGIDICSALEICSKKSIIHRDIKPENIFINEYGYFKLGDFGIAKRLESLNASHSQKGTFNYMAPEVASGTHYDARVDIYSLGIVLYRLLNNNCLPFIDSTNRLNPEARKTALERRLNGETFPAPAQASKEIADVIMKACAYKPEDRYQDASEFKEALQKAEATLHVPQSGVKETVIVGASVMEYLDETMKLQPGKDLQPSTGRKTEREVAENRKADIIDGDATVGVFCSDQKKQQVQSAEEPTPEKSGSSHYENASSQQEEITPSAQQNSEPPKKKDGKKIAFIAGTIAAVLAVLVVLILLLSNKSCSPGSGNKKSGNTTHTQSTRTPSTTKETKKETTSEPTVPELTTEAESSSESESTTEGATNSYKIANVVGKTQSEAEKILQDQGFKVAIAEINDDSAEAGRVTDQNPKAGTLLSEGETVTISVSKGKSSISVTFNGNGGTPSAAQMTVYKAAPYGNLPTAERSGYTFAGWFTAANGGTNVTSNTVVSETGNHSLYAHWEVNSYPLSWDDVSGLTIKVTRTSSPQAGATTGTMQNGGKVFYGDVLHVDYAASAGFELDKHGSDTITVTGPISSAQIYATTNSAELTYHVVYKSSNGTNLGNTDISGTFNSTATVTPIAIDGYSTPETQTVAFDSLSPKTITFTYTPSVVTIQTLKNNEWWWKKSSTTGIKYTLTVQFSKRTANSVTVKIVWTNKKLKDCYFGYTQAFTMTVNGVSTGKQEIADSSAFSSGTKSQEKTQTKAVTITVTGLTPDQTSVPYKVTTSCADANPGSFSGTIVIPAY